MRREQIILNTYMKVEIKKKKKITKFIYVKALLCKFLFFFYLCISVVHLVCLNGFSAGLAAMVDHHIELSPGPEFSLPVWDGGERGDDQERTLNVFHVYLIEECNGLDRLSQPHLICQDTVTSVEEKQNSWI